jgi:IS30 family transposase
LRGKEELKQVEVTQIKDEIRYLSQSDKIEIYRWLDRELVSVLPYRIGSHRSITIRQEIERTWKEYRDSEQPKGERRRGRPTIRQARKLRQFAR